MSEHRVGWRVSLWLAASVALLLAGCDPIYYQPPDEPAAESPTPAPPPPKPPAAEDETLGSALHGKHPGEALPEMWHGHWFSAAAGWPPKSVLPNRAVAIVTGREMQLFDGTRAAITGWSFEPSADPGAQYASVSVTTKAAAPWNALSLRHHSGKDYPLVWTLSAGGLLLGSVEIDTPAQKRAHAAELAIETLRAFAGSSPLSHDLEESRQRIGLAETALATAARDDAVYLDGLRLRQLKERADKLLGWLREDVSFLAVGAGAYEVAMKRMATVSSWTRETRDLEPRLRAIAVLTGDASAGFVVHGFDPRALELLARQAPRKLEERLLAIGVMSADLAVAERLILQARDLVLPENLILLAAQADRPALAQLLIELGTPLAFTGSLHRDARTVSASTWTGLVAMAFLEAKHFVTTGQPRENVPSALPSNEPWPTMRFACMGRSAVSLAGQVGLDDIYTRPNSDLFDGALERAGAGKDCYRATTSQW